MKTVVSNIPCLPLWKRGRLACSMLYLSGVVVEERGDQYVVQLRFPVPPGFKAPFQVNDGRAAAPKSYWSVLSQF